MTKALSQTIVFILVFIGLWMGLSEINWLKIFEVKENKVKTEKKLGDLIWKEIEKTEKKCLDKEINSAINSAIIDLCLLNKVDTQNLKIHVLENKEVNAFALPDDHIVIYTGLINATDKQEELIGVIGHELAHLTEGHIMKKIVNEFGMALIVGITTGNNGNNVTEVVKMLSNKAFDRNLEKEADIKAINYLMEAGVNPLPFSDFLFKMSLDTNDESIYLEWLSTHPSSEERAKYLLEYIEKGDKKLDKKLISEKTWRKIKAKNYSAI